MSKLIHFEILADDPHKLADFYKVVMGWQINAWPEMPDYLLITTVPDDNTVVNGAIMHRDFPQAVINTIEVESLEAALEKVVTAGGQKLYGPNLVPGVGLHAYCADPEGNLFGLMEPRPGN